MTIEITSTDITNRIVTINATDVSEEHLQRMERTRDDGFERELTFSFDLCARTENIYLYRFLHRQKAVKDILAAGEHLTLKEALQATVGTVTQINGKYLNMDDWAA